MNESKSDDLIQEVELEYPLFTIASQTGQVLMGRRDSVFVIWLFTNIELAELFAEQLGHGSKPDPLSEESLRAIVAVRPTIAAAVLNATLHGGYWRLLSREELLS